MQQKSFGKLPSGKRLERIKNSPNYKDGSFMNLIETPMLSEDTSYPKMMKEFFFSKGINREPTKTLPSIKTNLKTLDGAPMIVWFGHSTYLIIVDGKKILVDPVFSAYASPVQYFGSKNYAVTNPYAIEDFPDVDLVVISHDHYDHLDYNTVLKLKSKTKFFCVPLGIGSHLEYWGVEESKIKEFDWWQTEEVVTGVELTSTPARHFSGRGFKRGQTLWSSYVLKVGKYKLFIGGDSGYDESFKKIGEKYGPFDIVMLECGQYDKKWPYIHMMPEQTVQASIDLQANVLLPVHWGKFTLALHPWTEPIDRAVKAADSLKAKLTTPVIGDPIRLDSIAPGSKWWE
ncbi:MAG: MBL fold metallo-hydrolase [Cyclobacteriaceae bacterium]|nr:MBL fold metallo-hydrolase [Cyclobacteriaceae bacterium]